MNFMRQTWVWVTGSAVAALAFIRSIVFFKLRLRGKHATMLLDMVRSTGRSFVMKEEMNDASTMPAEFSAYCMLNKMPFFFSIEERILQAGMSGTEVIASATVCRWDIKKFKQLLTIQKKQTHIGVHILMPWDAQRIGAIRIPETVVKPYLDETTYESINSEISRVIAGDNNKTGILLYGPPGNGKSFLIRHFALKYQIPLYIVALTKDLDNHNLIKMFSSIPTNSIVLFEDFDSYFNKRECLINEACFTFDVILNVLDGVFSTPEGVVFFMTGNDIGRFDLALCRRPSRFRVVKELNNPSELVRYQIFKDKSIVEKTEGYSLDMCLHVRDKIALGETDALSITDYCCASAPLFFPKVSSDDANTPKPMR